MGFDERLEWTTADNGRPTVRVKGSQVSACGPAGSVVIYNGSVWHAHGANRTSQPRRSIQGAYIHRDDKQAMNQAARIRPDTLKRLGGLAKYVLDVESQRPASEEPA